MVTFLNTLLFIFITVPTVYLAGHERAAITPSLETTRHTTTFICVVMSTSPSTTGKKFNYFRYKTSQITQVM